MLTVTAIFFSITVSGQSRISQSRFDSVCDRAMSNLASDIKVSEKSYETLSAYYDALSDIQRARLGYLRMKILDAVKADRTPPDELRSVSSDSIQLVARRYLERSMPDKAIPLLMKALQTFPVNSNDAGHVSIELSEAYRQKQEYRKGVSLIYGLFGRQTPLSERNRAYACNRLAALYNEWAYPAASYTDSVFKYSELCIEIAGKSDDIPDLAASQNELCLQYILKKEYNKALDYSRKSVSSFISASMPFQAMNALINQSYIFAGRKEYRSALSSLNEATRLAPVWENRNLYMRIYRQYAEVYSLTGDYRTAYQFLQLCNSLQDDFFKDRINSQILEQAAKYDLIMKDQMIQAEKKKNEFNHRQIILLIIITITLSLAFVVSIFYFRLKRQGALKQKLIETVVETETSERRRIARDLHDGLGPVLSAINHYFQAFLDAGPENREAIQARLHTVITEAIDEVSRISHNISPHVLEKHGLMTALNNLLAPLAANGKYKISFTSELEQRLDPRIELTVYRCITELINNTMKHADAGKITLDIKHPAGLLLIRYCDNGRGFDPLSGNREGMGLASISSRIASFGGKMSLESSPNAGVSVYITLPV